MPLAAARPRLVGLAGCLDIRSGERSLGMPCSLRISGVDLRAAAVSKMTTCTAQCRAEAVKTAIHVVATETH